MQFKGNLVADVKFPFIAAEEDTGPIVKALVKEPAGKNVIGYREWLTLGEVSEAFTKAAGIKSEVVTLPLGEFHLPVPDELKLELSDNAGYWNEFGYEGRDDPTIIHPSDVSYLDAGLEICTDAQLQLETSLSLGTVEGYFKKQDWDPVFSS